MNEKCCVMLKEKWMKMWSGKIVSFSVMCLAMFVMTTTPGEADGFWKKRSEGDGLMEVPFQGRPDFAPYRYQVFHDPKGPTYNHDYYDPSSKQLIQLVESAHVNRILPNLRASFTAPSTRRKGYLDQALREVEYTLERLVNHPKALALSASVTKMLGRPNLPLTYYQRAVTLYPKRAMTQAQFGNFLVEQGEFKDGIERLKIAIKINPKLRVAYGWLAWAYHKHGQPELAKEYVTKAKKRGFRGKLPTLKTQ